LVQNNKSRGIEVSKSSVINIHNSSIFTNGSNALAITGSSSGYMNNLSIAKNNGNGMLVQGSSVRLGNSTISENNERGLTADPGAAVALDNVSIMNHPRAGVWGYGSRIFIEDSTISENNLNSVDWAGVHVLENAQLNLRKTIVSNNNQDGIHATKGAHVSLHENNMIENNTRNGIYLMNNASVMHGWGSIIRNNQETGVYLSRSSSGNFNQLTIESNQGHGIEVTKNSFLRISDVDISKNQYHGVKISNNSSVEAERVVISENSNAIDVNEFSSIDIMEDIQIQNNAQAALRLDQYSNAQIHETTSAKISNNPNGIWLNFSSIISFHDSTPTISDDLELGKNTQMLFFRSNTSMMTGNVECWTLYENSERNRQLYNFPVIEYQEHQSELLPITDDDCGVWSSN